jgi:Secretion system C-terminal sorting domain
LLFVQSAFVNEKVTLQIIGADGKKWKEAVFEKATNRLSVNVSSLPSGTYLLRLITKTKTETGQFIKE